MKLIWDQNTKQQLWSCREEGNPEPIGTVSPSGSQYTFGFAMKGWQFEAYAKNHQEAKANVEKLYDLISGKSETA